MNACKSYLHKAPSVHVYKRSPLLHAQPCLLPPFASCLHLPPAAVRDTAGRVSTASVASARIAKRRCARRWPAAQRPHLGCDGGRGQPRVAVARNIRQMFRRRNVPRRPARGGSPPGRAARGIRPLRNRARASATAGLRRGTRGALRTDQRHVSAAAPYSRWRCSAPWMERRAGRQGGRRTARRRE